MVASIFWQEEEEQRKSYEALQHQYEIATWRMQDRILRYREKHSQTGTTTNNNQQKEATSTEIGYFDDDDDEDLLDEEEYNCDKNQQLLSDEDDFEPEIFQMDL